MDSSVPIIPENVLLVGWLTGQSHLISDAQMTHLNVPPGGMRPDGHL